ncbi:MAG: hypothetical protein ACE5M4_02095, partial [Anaerolineales bacterium]
KSMAILESYPKAGMVTSRPFRTREHLMTATIRWAEESPEAEIEQGNFIPWETFREFDRSLGQSESEVRERYEATQDYRITHKDVTAHIGASHWQFIARKDVLQQFLPFSMDRPMGQVLKLDEQINDAGYLRLMTTEPLSMNMSNSVLPVPGERAPRYGRSGSLKRQVLDLAPVRRGLLWLYDRVFAWYFIEA